MRITSKGQVTIPQTVREKLGLLPYTEVEFVIEGERAYLHKLDKPGQRGQRLIKHMRGRATLRMSTDEILALTRDE